MSRPPASTRARVDVWALIRDLVSSGTTVLLTTQYLDEADRLADRIGVIHEGRLITEGTGNELKDRLGGAVIQVEVPEAAQAATRAALGADDGTDGTITLPAPAGSRIDPTDMARRRSAGGHDTASDGAAGHGVDGRAAGKPVDSCAAAKRA